MKEVKPHSRRPTNPKQDKKRSNPDSANKQTTKQNRERENKVSER